jgi:hypothetical protein
MRLSVMTAWKEVNPDGGQFRSHARCPSPLEVRGSGDVLDIFLLPSLFRQQAELSAAVAL